MAYSIQQTYYYEIDSSSNSINNINSHKFERMLIADKGEQKRETKIRNECGQEGVTHIAINYRDYIGQTYAIVDKNRTIAIE